jgi:hypothetical protein
MMPWRRRPRLVPWLAPWLALGGAGLIAIGLVTMLVLGDDEGPRGDDAALPTTTDVIAALGTAVPPPPLDLCSTDPQSLAVWTARVEVDRRTGTADAVVRFENLTGAACELDLTDPVARADGVEASVRLAPGGWGELLIGSRGSECERLLPTRSVDLELNGDDRTVLTAAVIACEPALLAFLPADHPVDQCLATDLEAAVADTGLVVRNDGERPCLLGALISVELPTGPAPSLVEMAQTRPGHAIDGPVGPEVTALGPGDVAYFQTLADPAADCTRSFHPARLNFTDLRLDVEFPICTFVRLGPGRPFFGSPRGPLAGAGSVGGSDDDIAAWLGELDPFRES